MLLIPQNVLLKGRGGHRHTAYAFLGFSMIFNKKDKGEFGMVFPELCCS
jgi:hypothetical protein